MATNSLLETKKSILQQFQGPVCAVATAFNDDGQLNVEQIVDYARHLKMIGVKGVYILGTTGESFTLTFDEKYQIIQAWYKAIQQLDSEMDNNNNQFLAIVNITSMSLNESKKLLKLMKNLQRFNAWALLAPIFYPVTNVDQFITMIKDISIDTDCQLPFLYYHFPDRTGQQNFELETFTEKALKCLPQFSAIKFTDTNIVRMAKMQRKFGKFIKIFAGYDEVNVENDDDQQTLLAARTVVNINAGICATFSLKNCVQSYLKILDSIDQGNLQEAQNYQQILAEFCQQLQSNGNFFSSLKQCLNDELSSTKGLQFGRPRMPVWIPTNPRINEKF